ncbi:hypothetical protein HUG17_7920 [Dermatophagoides farinae]|uniref:Uncharacterized protein n=1 Tax=Dermatophagoides farinae TaxID=6954 RepID=A0A9D4NXX0_DERFA|nr:hypothetical protein HUG17_7920 [Dermatophagoides farinae]
MNWNGGYLQKFRPRKMTQRDLEKIKIEENIKRRQQQSKCLKEKDKQSISLKQVMPKRIIDRPLIIRSKYFEPYDNFISKSVKSIIKNDDCQDENVHPNKENDEIPFEEFAEIYPEDEINPDQNCDKKGWSMTMSKIHHYYGIIIVLLKHVSNHLIVVYDNN